MAFRNEQGIQPPPISNYGHLMGMLEHFWTTIRENIDLYSMIPLRNFVENTCPSKIISKWYGKYNPTIKRGTVSQ